MLVYRIDREVKIHINVHGADAEGCLKHDGGQADEVVIRICLCGTIREDNVCCQHSVCVGDKDVSG
jgi:hypothetical protein